MMSSPLYHSMLLLSHPSNPDQDELEVYGSESQSSGPSALASYKFEVCDSVLNIGPIKDMALGMPAFLSVSQLKESECGQPFALADLNLVISSVSTQIWRFCEKLSNLRKAVLINHPT